MASTDSVITSYFTEESWVIQISRAFEEEQPENGTYTPVCIYQVPKSISDVMPEAYTPQVIAIGPYHHFKPDLYKMQPYKLAAAKRAINQFQLVPFNQLTEGIEMRVADIRPCYYGALDIMDATLAKMMAVDGLFLLELLDTQVNSQEDNSQFYLADYLKKKMHRNAILKDVLMLENQIPFFVLSEILSCTCRADSKPSDESLTFLLEKFCAERSPIELYWRSYLEAHKHEQKHLLDVLYQAIISHPKDEDDKKTTHNFQTANNPSRHCCLPVIQTFNILLFLLMLLVYFCMMVPIKKLIGCFLYVLERFGVSTEFSTEKKVLIPSVEQLHNAGVNFRRSSGGIKSIEFNKEKGTFYLPVINMRPTSEVVMRNLVAYETLTETDCFPFKRYTELMNAMVDTTQDVELLIRDGIISSKLKHVEVLEILNGMGKSMASKDEIIQEAIDKANDYYNCATNVKMGRFMMKYVYSSWKILAVLGSTFLLVLTILQTICGFYNCPKLS